MEKRVSIVEEDAIGTCVLNDYHPTILIPDFIKLMGEIGIYGANKHGAASFQARAEAGNFERTERLSKVQIRHHINTHIFDYYYDQKHDHFGTLKHQLAAVAFNAMMEYWFLCKEHPEEAGVAGEKEALCAQKHSPEAAPITSEVNNPICECSHLKISHDKNGCGAFSIGCSCVKKYEVLSEPITYKEILP